MSNNIGVVFSLKDEFTGKIDGIVSKTNEADSAMNDAAKGADNFGEAGKSGFAKVAEGAASVAGGILVTKGLAGAWNLVKDGVAGAMERMDAMDQFERVLTSVTGDTKAVAAAMKDLETITDGTSMRMDVLANSIQGFVTSGVEIKKATKWAEAFGNAVAFYSDGSVESFQQVDRALGKIASSNKVGAREIDSLEGALIPVMQKMREETGKTDDEIRAMFNNGTIDGEDFIDMMSDIIMETEGAKTGMKDAGMTWKAVIDNVTNWVALGIQSIIESIDEMLKSNGLPDMREMIDEFGRAFGQAFEFMSPFIAAFVGSIGIAWGHIMDVNKAFGEFADSIINPVIEGWHNITGASEEAREEMDIMGPAMEVLGGVLAAVAIAFGVMVGWQTLVIITNGILTGATILLSGATAILNAVLWLGPWGLVALGIAAVVTVAILLYKNWDKLTAATKRVWEAFKKTDFVKNLTSEIKRLGGWVKKVEDFFAGLGKTFGNFAKKITDFKMPSWVSTIKSSIGSGVSAVSNFSPVKLASGTNEVPQDMLANIHKGEMVVPARQSANLRKQGTNINNIDKGGGGNKKPSFTRTLKPNVSGGGVSITGNNFYIREDADIDKVATALYRKMKATAFNMS